jgi:hypothetical protein
VQADEAPDRERRDPVASPDWDPVASVTEHAVRIAGERGANGVATADVLMAVMHVYGEDFDRVLRAHGSDRDEVLARLGARISASKHSTGCAGAAQDN